MALSTADVLALTESQRGLLVVDGLVPNPQIYNQVTRFDVDPSLPVPTVAAALGAVVTVQPALRQVFRVTPEMQARLTPPPSPDALPLECEEVPAGEYEATVRELAYRIGRERLDLATGPVYRFGHVRAADGSAAAVLLCLHHIAGDGVSLGPLVRDLDRALTGALDPGVVDALRSRRETTFRRELAAQLRVSESERTAQRAAEWAEAIRQVPSLMLYPRPNRPVETAFFGARLDHLLGEDETVALHDTCARLGITPFVLLTGLYGAVLARHAGVPSVLVGSPFSARRTVGAFDLCGFFVNTLPVTVEVNWARTVDEHLGEVVRSAVDDCRSAVDVPFSQLVAQARPDRSGTRNPLFSAMLVMQDTLDAGSTEAVRAVRELGNGTAKFDLWLGATPIGGRWLLELEYDRELIPPTVAGGLLHSLRTALRRALADGSRRLSDVFEDDSAAASRRTDGYPADVPAATLAGWVGATGARSPKAVAVEDAARRLTYAELDGAAARLAGGLSHHGVQAGDVVGLALDDLCDTTTAILALLRLGAAYLPLDPGLPAERLAYMVDKASCRLVLGSGLPVPSTPLSGLADGVRITADGVAGSRVYVSFTSGSTGHPKGVQMGHGPLLNLAAWQIAALGMGSDTRFLQYAPLGFDVSFQEIVPTLAAGGTVVSRAPADRRDFPALAQRIADTAVTHVYLPVAALRPFVHCVRRRRLHFPALRHVCVSGEQLVLDEEIRVFFAEHPHCRLVNLYGPTETHAVTTYSCSDEDADWPAHAPIGLPLAGVTAYVVDATGHLAPAGVPGELYLGGVCVADGYVNDPDRSAASFVPDRFSDAPGAVVYRTGDRVLRDHRGELVFLGREDTQVKIRGHRIELGEVESVAHGVAGVRQAVAVVRRDGPERELVLFVVAEAGAAVDHDAVRAELARVLPAYMVPVWVFDLDLVPTSGTGKTDRAALTAVADDLVARHDTGPAGPPVYADDVERTLAAIWSGILGCGDLPAEASLLEHGAHSLTMFTAFAQVEEQFGVAVPVLDFFRSPTIATLARLVRAGGTGGE